jgi:hypothetical protein
MTFLRSKLTLVVLSAILIGSAGAVLAGMSAVRPPSFSAALAASNSTGATNTAGSAATATTAGHSAGGTPGATATGAGATPTNTSVPTPRPTRTPTPIPIVNQPLTIHGDVTSVNTGNNTFVVNVGGGGGTYTITVSPPGGATNWSGPIKTLSQLASSPGARATVTGVYKGNGALDATSATNNGTVYAYIDN